MNALYKKEIVANLRGFFLSSVIYSLFEKSYFKDLIKNKGLLKNNRFLKKNKKFRDLINYLIDINYMNEKSNSYEFTELGLDIFSRYYTFLVPCSYNNYLLNLDKFLVNKFKPSVDRKKNIIGSGITHKRYFYSAISFLKAKVKKIQIIDLGCGNGFFLKTADRLLDLDKIAGIDLSNISIKNTKFIFKKKKE